MNSNIEFKSNVYPVVGSAMEDKVYLSKIYDHVRLRILDKRFGGQAFTYRLFNEFQKKIIVQVPVCPYCKPDPCWGPVIKNNQPFWVCKCVKIDCPSFSNCRTDFDESELKLFSPLYNSLNGYEYGYGDTSTTIYHDIVYYGEDCLYETNAAPAKEVKSNVSEDINQIIEIVKVLKETTPENNLAKETIDETAVAHESLVTKETDVSDDISDSMPHVDYATDVKYIENMFDCFEETTQDEIIAASPKETLFVDAGPGTGKTYTLIQKINYMVTEQGVDPEGILVLCFTNAAVDEIRSRLNIFIESGADRGLINVDIRTFHSFAWWLISQCNELFSDKGWAKIQLNNLNSFDLSIRLASQALSQFFKEIVEYWEHFIVDEVQDLTNDLGRFVLNIVNSCLSENCGVTVLGDSCQAIYDYTNEHNHNPLTSEQFYSILFKNLYCKARFLKLTENKRQTTDLILLNEALRNAILSKNTQVMKVETKSVMQKIGVLEKSISSIQIKDLEELCGDERICFLFRNNGQTLKTSSVFRKRGIPHQLNVTETSHNFCPWIADVFANYEKKQMSYDVFEELYEQSTSTEYSAFTIWSRLKELLHTDDDVLFINKIIDSIANSKIDDSIFRTRNSDKVIVSNIHRAKGREYGCVAIDSSFGDSLLSSNDKKIDEYKTMYVAITRAKEQLVSIKAKEKSELYPIEIFASKRKRWGEIKRKTKMTFLEFINSIDNDINEFAFLNQSELSKINVGDSLYLKRVISSNRVRYQLIHEESEMKLGFIAQTYADDIENRMGIQNAVDMPALITDLYVAGVYTKIVDADFLSSNPKIGQVAKNGIWKWIDIIGAGHMSYDTY